MLCSVHWFSATHATDELINSLLPTVIPTTESPTSNLQVSKIETKSWAFGARVGHNLAKNAPRQTRETSNSCHEPVAVVAGIAANFRGFN